MKIKDGFVIRKIADNYVIIATGNEALDFKGVITINEVGAFIWNKINETEDFDATVAAVTAEYNIDEERAKNDCREFVNSLIEHDIVEE